MNARFLDNERLADLLVQLETEGLDEAGSRELDALLAQAPGAGRDALAPAAAALTLAARLPLEPLPPSLHGRLVEQGRAAVRELAASKVVEMTSRASPAPASAFGSRLGWYAAAASLVLAVAAWWPSLTREPVDETPAVATLPPTPAEARARMLASGEGVIVESWSSTEDPASASVRGDVVWDEATQHGYMRFAGLPANDPGQEQYQLWIFDATRDDRFPVDGGVFDIPAGTDEVVVPITARLPVRQAALFAVTVEQPGGVVVSSRERIVALAQVAAG